jgi:hypothetical protein
MLTPLCFYLCISLPLDMVDIAIALPPLKTFGTGSHTNKESIVLSRLPNDLME